MRHQDNLIEQLERYRLEKQLTQAVLAKRLGIARVTLSRWLNGHVIPRDLERYRAERLLRKR